MRPDFVEIKTFSFSAFVPEFLDMPSKRVIDIFNLHDEHQVAALVQLFRDQLAPEKQIEFDSLSLSDVLETVQKWVKPHEK